MEVLRIGVVTEVMDALGMPRGHPFDLEWQMDVDAARRRLMATWTYEKYAENVKLFSAQSRGGKNFRAMKDRTESFNHILGQCGMRVQTKGERKGANVQRGNRKYELVEEEAMKT